jgi:phage pi2 protein 07
MFEQFLLRAKVYAFNRNVNRYEHKWVEGYLTPISITEQGPQFIITEPVKGECMHDHHYNGDDHFSYKPVEYGMFVKETVSRWTGLLDKNGKKIWEDDILKWETLGSDYMHLVVRYDNGGWTAYPCNDFDRRHMKIRLGGEQNYCEVIGNKWDNPELLEGSE